MAETTTTAKTKKTSKKGLRLAIPGVELRLPKALRRSLKTIGIHLR
ncbi:MAG TPA: hypothetical protein PKX14_11395 [Thauera aminoaromatica]|nr:hypothetical protein [Thauera aminoaromatica]